MFSVQLAPAASVIGKAGQLPPAAVMKPVPLVMVETVMEAEPMFASITLWVGLATPTSPLGKVNVGRVPERTSWFSLSAMERLPSASGATERGELRIAPVERPAFPP